MHQKLMQIAQSQPILSKILLINVEHVLSDRRLPLNFKKNVYTVKKESIQIHYIIQSLENQALQSIFAIWVLYFEKNNI
jgi:hypothetical protein